MPPKAGCCFWFRSGLWCCSPASGPSSSDVCAGACGVHRLRLFVPALILFAGCAMMIKAHSQYRVALAGRLTSVMADVQGYDVTIQSLSDDEVRVAGMSEYVARAYSRDSAVVFTTFVSYYDRQTQGRTIHSPRN